ncbi:hypothetical protein C7T35_30140 [Variovorax sp. WS11]|uniref:hypothetical protein n=1 Tax=Variovorax sp. WS11 TaxID=1105204 RepID=UPI000D0CCE8D|nr:hypothetical protein [Variovorax sp. WS11]NDZ12841.1 hypothetical protein [Variovorax sp. WS11]PSL80843.1 hypothetical protein C7T35_30140 [Variovorax sp. WS11]
MDTLLLVIAINFLVVPFLQEAEAQGRQLQRFPGFVRILRLAHVRRSHWLRPFCIAALLFLAFAVLRAQSGQVEGLTVVVHFTIMQFVLWTVVSLSVRKPAHAPSHAGTSVDELPGRPIATLLPRRS